MSGVVAFEGELNSIVKEYLEFSQFKRTSSAFQMECVERGKHLSSAESKARSDQKPMSIQKEMLQYFDTGKRREMLDLWVQYVPEKIRNEDSVAQKLEFYLYIYFAIYPLKYNEEDTESGMTSFKRYLETRGAALSQTTEFLPFYALPFVPNPTVHPSYKELFSDKWIPDLRIRLEKFLTLALKSTPQPRLFELYQGSGGQVSDFQGVEQRIADADRKMQSYIKRYNRVQADYHNLIGITADLVDSLESTVQGNPVSPEYLQHVCMRLFSNQLRQTMDFSRPGTAGEVLRQSVVPPQGLSHKDTVPGGSLDYEKIKSDLVSAPERQRGLLLQALRWKLTKSTPPERDAVMSNYIRNDLLGCMDPGIYRASILQLFKSDSEAVQQYIARLFNAFASLCDGRTYLSHNSSLLRGLMESLQEDQRDSLTRENVLGCLQKLSLRRQLQTLMIQEGIIDWLVSVLEDNDSLSDYTLEYSVALMMNLCLRTAGKHKCVQDAGLVLKVLTDLLGHENKEIIPYVNGTLYSILAIPSIREEAKAMGMEEILRCFLKAGQPDMNRQIEFIIRQLNSTEEPDDAESDDEDEEDEEDQDAMENDLDKAELIKPQSGELYGDRLLNTHYVSTAPAASRKKRPTDGTSNQEDLLMRPVTPSQRKGDQPVVHVQPRSRPHTASSSRPHTSSSSKPPSRGGNTHAPRSHSRPTSRDAHRPPTRSGSRPSSAAESPVLRTPSPKVVDPEGSETVAKATGQAKKLAAAAETKNLKPSTKSMAQVDNKENGMNEYQAAFSTRPKIPRTPDSSSSRPMSRGSVGEGPTPQPKYSDSLPTPRPGSGSGSGNQTPASPTSRHRPSSANAKARSKHR